MLSTEVALCHFFHFSLRNLMVPCGCSNSYRISREPKLLIEKEKSKRVLLWTKAAQLQLREKRKFFPLASAAEGFPARETLDLTEDHIKQVLADARVELGQIFDTSVGMTGEVELAELDGPFVTIRLKGRFWHKRSTVVARVGNYLKQRIPEILEVDIENEKQLDDSPENF